MKKILLTCTLVFSAVLFSNTQAYSQAMSSNQANLLVYRDGFLYGAWKNFDVVIDGQKMGGLNKNKSEQSFELAPGSHSISAGNEKKAVTINMSGGNTYVVEYKVRFGLLSAVPKPVMKTVDEGKKDSKLVMEDLGGDSMHESM